LLEYSGANTKFIPSIPEVGTKHSLPKRKAGTHLENTPERKTSKMPFINPKQSDFS